ncbi:hypothetical protein, partial [Prevotella sp. P4-119]|uniref:hypothetical protein n=1 Tax=Prevotella sp. P4-119 TaxID=2024218 RepID=UPI001C1F82AC
MKKNNRLFHLSPTCEEMSQLVAFTCVSICYKAKFWSVNLGGYCILLNIRKIGGTLYFYWLETVVGSWVRIRRCKEKSRKRYFSVKRKNGVTALQYNNITVLKNQNL